ncbi:MAG TPA: PrsW family glutamic-type intramembrane protease [Candidatus Paceibacterota bacterium]
MNEFGTIAFAAAGGALPALMWLWFWLREDSAHPEPRQLIALAFLCGMLTVAITIPIQKFAATFIVGTTFVFIAWSFIEEILKYMVARFTILWRKEVDEPIDMVMYMITLALGFAAVENTLFLLSPLAGEGFMNTLLTGNLRFIGATLLHVFTSAIVGVFLAISFYKKPLVRMWYAITGVILAAVLHSAFNFFILNSSDQNLFRIFAGVWVGVVVVLAILEYIKRIR